MMNDNRWKMSDVRKACTDGLGMTSVKSIGNNRLGIRPVVALRFGPAFKSEAEYCV
jgi:hypothetical protein